MKRERQITTSEAELETTPIAEEPRPKNTLVFYPGPHAEVTLKNVNGRDVSLRRGVAVDLGEAAEDLIKRGKVQAARHVS